LYQNIKTKIRCGKDVLFVSILNFSLSEEKVYIGIDPSLTATALVAVTAKGQMVKSTICKTAWDGPRRLVSIRDQADRFITQFGDQTVLVGIEHYAMGAKFGREAAGELGGVLRVMMYENSCEYIEIAPMQLKQFATGKGTAQKDHVLMAVYKKWGMEFRTNDEADAFVAAQIARAVDMVRLAKQENQSWGKAEEIKLTAYEAVVVEKILNPVKKGKKNEKKAG
jgi:crossover junction endodeoxyribonuclease RuvC